MSCGALSTSLHLDFLGGRFERTDDPFFASLPAGICDTVDAHLHLQVSAEDTYLLILMLALAQCFIHRLQL
jgi:hypothetical protein